MWTDVENDVERCKTMYNNVKSCRSMQKDVKKMHNGAEQCDDVK